MKHNFWDRKIYKIIARQVFINPTLKTADLDYAESDVHNSRKMLSTPFVGTSPVRSK